MKPVRIQQLEERGRLRLFTSSPDRAAIAFNQIAALVSIPITLKRAEFNRFVIVRKDKP